MRNLALVTAVILAISCGGIKSSMAAPGFDGALVASAANQSLMTKVGCAVRRVCGVRGCVRRRVCW
jgi:hypothetical protein